MLPTLNAEKSYVMKRLLLLSILLIQANALFTQSLDSEQLDSIIVSLAKEYSIVGLSIGVSHKDKTETKSYGKTSLNAEWAITDSTLFNVASITKLFTATAILQLIEEGKLELNDKLVDVLPNFKMKDKRHSEITIDQLLTHSSGLMWDNKLSDSPNDETALPLYLAHLENKKLSFRPGSKMAYQTYSNVAFDLLGLVIEELTKQSYPEFIQQNQLEPLGLTFSTFDHTSIDPSRLALPQIIAGNSKEIDRLNFKGVDSKKNPIINGKPLTLKVHDTIGEDYEHNPSGNLLSSTSELILWVKEIINIYNQTSTHSIVSKQSLDKMWTKQHSANGDISIGLGWWINENEKYGTTYFHVGTNPGYCSILMIYPEKELGIVILSNAWYGKEVIWNKLFYEFVEAYHKD